jgi:hypothetical protein
MVLYRSATVRGPHVSSRSGVDGRFDVQVRQSLPFLDFESPNGKCCTVRLLHDVTGDRSIYDELLSIRPKGSPGFDFRF